MTNAARKWKPGDLARVECDDTAHMRGVHEVRVEAVTRLNCGCVKLTTTRPGEPAGSRDMYVLDTRRCDSMHNEPVPAWIGRSA